MTIVEPLSALLITSVGLLISSFKAFLSILVRLSDSFCLCLCLLTTSSLTVGKCLGSPFLPVDVKNIRHNIHDHKINANTSYFFL